MILNSPYISGSIIVTDNSVFSGSITVLGGISGSSAVSASYAVSASFAATATSASQAQNAISSSFATNAANANLLDGKDSTEFAITGSNIFTGTQYNTSTSNPNGFGASASIYTDGGVRITRDAYVSGTMFVNNLTVFGTQSVNYVTSSQLNISTNIISVNTDTPSIRFGGLSVYDSGSTGLTGSMLWDSERDHWVYSNPSGSSYNSGMMISGPRNSGSLGTEQGTLNNYIVKGQGGDHVTSSLITETGIATTFYTNSLYVSASGNVGIGITNPAYKLHVVGSSFIGRQNNYGTYDSADADLIVSNYNSDNTSILLFNSLGAYHSGLVNYYNNILSLGLNNSNSTNSILTSTAINITSTGVGIGTSSPLGSSKVHIMSINGTSYSSAAQLRISGGTNNNRAQILFSDDALSDGKISYYAAASDADKIMSISARTTESDFVIRGSGNVGIGTSAPNSILEVQRDTNGDTPITFINGSGGSGNTNASISLNFTLRNGSGGSSGGVILKVGKETDHQGANVNDYFAISTTRSDVIGEKLRITSSGTIDFNGNSTIGSANDKFALGVNSTSYAWLQSFGGRNLVLNASGNNVLIGTTTSNGRGLLQVNSNISANNITTFSLTLQGTGTPVSTGLGINAGSGGRTYLILTSQQWDAGNSTSSTITMIRCGYDGNNFTAVVVSSSNLQTETWSQSGGILYVAGNTNFQMDLTVISNG